MAIKLPDPGNGIPEQKTGNDEWTNMQIVRDNFADQSNAASKLVGTEAGKIPLVQDIYSVAGGIVSVINGANGNVDTFEIGTKKAIQSATNEPPVEFRAGNRQWMIETFSVLYLTSDRGAFQMAYGRGGNKAIAFRNQGDDGYTEWVNIYTTANVTKDGNGFLKGASPVVDLYDDHIDLNGDAKEQGIEFVKNGTGDYTLKTKTGLRSDSTWQIEIPQDNNKNPLFAVDIDAQDDGTINIKCYKRIFSMETFLFGPDFNEPVDITEGRFISVRLNDNPDPEQTDEPVI